MIKLKKLIKESAWDRKFGEPLPTLEDVVEKHQTEEKSFAKTNSCRTLSNCCREDK